MLVNKNSICSNSHSKSLKFVNAFHLCASTTSHYMHKLILGFCNLMQIELKR